MSSDWSRLRKKLRALNYAPIFGEEAAPLVDRLLSDLIKASEAYQSAKAAAPRPDVPEAEAWRAVRAVERENCELHAALLAKERQLGEAAVLAATGAAPDVAELRARLETVFQKNANGLQAEVLRLRALLEAGQGVRGRATADMDVDRRKTEELLHGQIAHLVATNERLRADSAQVEPLRAAEKAAQEQNTELHKRLAVMEQRVTMRSEEECTASAVAELHLREIGKLQVVVERSEREKDALAAEKVILEAKIDGERRDRVREAGQRSRAEETATAAMSRLGVVEEQLTCTRLALERLRSEAVPPTAETAPTEPLRLDLSPQLALREKENEGLRQLLEQERESRLAEQKTVLELRQRLSRLEKEWEQQLGEKEQLSREASEMRLRAEQAEERRRAADFRLKAAQLEVQRWESDKPAPPAPEVSGIAPELLAEARQRERELEEEVRLLRTQLDKREAKISELGSAQQVLEAAVTEARTEVARLRLSLEAAERRREDGHQTLAASEARLFGAEAQALKSREQLEALRAQLEVLAAERERFGNEASVAREKVAQLGEELYRTQAQLSAAQSLKATEEDRLAHLAEHLHALSDRAALAEKREAGLECTIQLKDEQLCAVQAEVQQLHALIRGAGERQSILTPHGLPPADARQSARLEADLNATREQLAAAQEEHLQMRRHLEHLDQERDELVAALDVRSAAADEQAQRVRQAEAQRDEFRIAAENWRRALAESRAETAEVLARFEALVAEKARLADELSALGAQAAELESAKRDLFSDVQLLAREGAVMTAEAEAAHRRREATERRMSERAERLHTVELQLAATTMERDQLATNCQEFARQLGSANSAVAKLQASLDVRSEEAAAAAVEGKATGLKVQDLRQQLERAALELAATRQDNTRLTLQLQSDAVATAEAEAAFVGGRERTAAVEKTLANLQKELSARESALAVTSEELNSQRQVFLHLQLKNEELTGKYVNLLRRHSS